MWAEEGQRVLAELEQERPGVVLQQLQLHWTRHPDLPPAHFRKMWALATGLGSEAIRQECRWAWARCQDTWLALDQKLEASLKLPPVGSTASLCVSQVPTAPAHPPLRKAYSFDRNLGQSLSEPARHRHHAATIAACCRPEAGGGAPPQASPTVPPPGSSDPRSPNRLQLVLAEMVATEREYVRALEYTMENYFPELDRPDVPQGLRGQRAHLFGNLEKLRDFHCHFFLRELEACTRHPPRVAYAFLRHRVQFGMYALYSKNKPRSDALMSSYGHTFFKDKQQALGDHLDLASYLLKPIQRMGKYALLLQELARACGGPMQELSALREAQSLVHFQLRHGNDLLAMDAIQGCDVNLKEQGQLVRQDEFVVRTGRHKSVRRIFLLRSCCSSASLAMGPQGLTHLPISAPSRWQTLVSLSAVGTATCASRSGSAAARPGTPLCFRPPAWPSSRPGRLTSPAYFGGRPSTTRRCAWLRWCPWVWGTRPSETLPPARKPSTTAPSTVS